VPLIEEGLRSTIKMKLLAIVLLVLFFVGLVGSAIVVVVKFIEELSCFSKKTRSQSDCEARRLER